MSGEYAADAAVGHASEETHTGAVDRSWVHVFEGFRADDDCYDQDCLPDHPDNELMPAKEKEELIEVVCWLSDGTEDGYEDCAGAYEHCADEGVACEGFSKDQGGAYGVENQSGLYPSAFHVSKLSVYGSVQLVMLKALAGGGS